MSALMLLLGVFIPFVIIVLFFLLLLGMCVAVAGMIWSLLCNDPYRFNAVVQSFYLAHDGICLKVREKVKRGKGAEAEEVASAEVASADSGKGSRYRIVSKLIVGKNTPSRTYHYSANTGLGKVERILDNANQGMGLLCIIILLQCAIIFLMDIFY